MGIDAVNRWRRAAPSLFDRPTDWTLNMMLLVERGAPASRFMGTFSPVTQYEANDVIVFGDQTQFGFSKYFQTFYRPPLGVDPANGAGFWGRLTVRPTRDIERYIDGKPAAG